MLKQRILTAFFLIPILIALIILLPPNGFFVLTTLVILGGAFEWCAFIGLKKILPCFGYISFLLLLLVFTKQLPIFFILWVALIGWLIALGLVISYPKSALIWGKSFFLRALMGIGVLIPCGLAIYFIRNSKEGLSHLFFLFLLIWGADTGAFFIGKKWGKNKLAPNVSPGKTWQGLAGALFVTTLIVVSVVFILKIPYERGFLILLFSFVIVLFSVLGDLFESMLKRNSGLKDSGKLLPGHGGILDRIDSLTAAAPMFALGQILFGKIFQ